MKSTIANKYLEALKIINDWVTVSEWAIRVGELYPDLLEKANKEALGQKKRSTGLREIAARISSNISRGAFAGLVEVDETDRPRKVKYLTKSEQLKLEQAELEADIEPISRNQKINEHFGKLSTKEKYRIRELESIKSDLKNFFKLDFDLEHAKAILNPADPGSHHPDNLQFLLGQHNRIKGKTNWLRFTVEEQLEYIKAAVQIQKLIAEKMNIEIDDTVLGALEERLKKVFNG